MIVCAIQQPYAYNAADAAAAVDFVVRELDSCDDSLDLIMTPEYSNAPSSFPPGGSLEFVKNHTAALEDAAIRAAVRCQAIVALSYCAETPYGWRNTTRVFDRSGKAVGDYYKQQLTEREPAARQVDSSYTRRFRAPEIVEVDGLRLGFVTCYDAYFNEYIEFLGHRQPDIVLTASHQRAEPCGNLRLLNQMLAYYTGAFVVRASVGMGEDSPVGGSSMIVNPAGEILADAVQRNGKLIYDIGDPHWKYFRSDSFGGKMISNRYFVEKGRTPWSYRPCGPCVKLNDKAMPYPRVCAHRGFNSVAPENSLPAFGAAIALGAEEIEFDLWETRDGVPVSIHDADLARVSNGSGFVRERTLAELQELDFGSVYAPEFAGLKVVTLEDILRTFPRQAVMNIHIKNIQDEYFSRPFVKKIADMLEEYDCEEHAYFMARPEVFAACDEVAPHICRCMGAGPFRAEKKIIEDALQWNCSKIQLFKPYFDADMIKRAHDLGLKCNFFYSDDPAEAVELVRMNIDTILTNDYYRVAQAVKSCAAVR